MSYYFSQSDTVYMCPGKVGNLCLVKGNICVGSCVRCK